MAHLLLGPLPMNVSSIITPNPQCAPLYMSISDAARLMRDHDIGMLPVCEDGRLVGLVTDRDLVVRGLAAGSDPKRTPVQEIMTKDPVSCLENDSIDKACLLMSEYRIRRLPVVNEQERLVGVLALADVVVRTRSLMRGIEILESVSQPQHQAQQA